MTKAVLDTNVFVSALINSKGKPAQIVAHASEGRFVLLLCDEIIKEIDVALHRKHIQKRFHPSEDTIDAFLEKIRRLGKFVEITEIENLIPQDPPDNVVLACAVEGDADYLVSGNLHFLNLKEYRSVKMTTPAQFLEILKTIAA